MLVVRIQDIDRCIVWIERALMHAREILSLSTRNIRRHHLIGILVRLTGRQMDLCWDVSVHMDILPRRSRPINLLLVLHSRRHLLLLRLIIVQNYAEVFHRVISELLQQMVLELIQLYFSRSW